MVVIELAVPMIGADNTEPDIIVVVVAVTALESIDDPFVFVEFIVTVYSVFDDRSEITIGDIVP